MAISSLNPPGVRDVLAKGILMASARLSQPAALSEGQQFVLLQNVQLSLLWLQRLGMGDSQLLHGVWVGHLHPDVAKLVECHPIPIFVASGPGNCFSRNREAFLQVVYELMFRGGNFSIIEEAALHGVGYLDDHLAKMIEFQAVHQQVLESVRAAALSEFARLTDPRSGCIPQKLHGGFPLVVTVDLDDRRLVGPEEKVARQVTVSFRIFPSRNQIVLDDTTQKSLRRAIGNPRHREHRAIYSALLEVAQGSMVRTPDAAEVARSQADPDWHLIPSFPMHTEIVSANRTFIRSAARGHLASRDHLFGTLTLTGDGRVVGSELGLLYPQNGARPASRTPLGFQAGTQVRAVLAGDTILGYRPRAPMTTRQGAALRTLFVQQGINTQGS